MSNTTISEVGKFFQTNGNAVNAIAKQTPSAGVQNNFGTMLKQTKGNNAEKNVQNTASNSSNAITQKFKPYQYKDKVVKSEKVETVSEDTVKEELNNFSDGVKEVLKEELGVSEEQIENAMQMLGLQFSDLMNQNNLANLVSKLTGTDSIQQLLCNEQFVTIMQGISEVSENLLKALNMNLEQFQNVLKEATDSINNQNNDLLKASDNAEEISQIVENSSADGQITEEVVDSEAVAQNDIFGNEKMTAENDIAASVKTIADQNTDTNVKGTAESGQSADIISKTGENSEMDEAENIISEQGISENPVMTEDGQTEFLNQQDEAGGNEAQTGNMSETADVSQNAQQTVVPQNQFVENFDNVEISTPLPENVNTRDVIDQIVESARVIATDQKTTMELQLNPESLGKVLLKVTQEEGALTAKITTQNAMVKEALEAQLVELKQNLEQAGVKVDAVEVTVSSHEFERNLEQNAEGEKQQGEQQEKGKNTHRRLNLNDLSELSGVMSDEETLVAKMMAEQGNSVNYTV